MRYQKFEKNTVRITTHGINTFTITEPAMNEIEYWLMRGVSADEVVEKPERYVLGNGNVTLLTIAVYRKIYKLVDLLLDYGANINLFNEKGVTPLSMAVINNDFVLVTRFLQESADVNYWCSIGPHLGTPLHLACYNGNYEIARLLLEKGADLNIVCVDGKKILAKVRDERLRALLEYYKAK